MTQLGAFAYAQLVPAAAAGWSVADPAMALVAGVLAVDPDSAQAQGLADVGSMSLACSMHDESRTLRFSVSLGWSTCVR